MNMLPSMLIAATLISTGTTAQGTCPSIDISALQSQLKDNCIESQVIIGNASDIQTILDKLGIDLDSVTDCFRPSVPETEIPSPDEAPESTPENTPENAPENAPENTPESAPEESTKSYAEQVVALVNEERAKVNLPALTMSEDVNHAAQIRAVETTKAFSHTRPDGSPFSTVLKENGISYRGAGENIAWGQKTPEAVVNAWMNSDGHRANILNKNFTTICVGYYMNGTTPYWVQLFTY